MEARAVYERWAAELTESIKSGQPVIKKTESREIQLSFYQMIDKYLEWAEPRLKGAKIKRYVFNRIKTFIPDMPLTQIDNNVLEKLQTAFIKKEFSIAYNNKAYNTIKAMLSKACNWDLISEDGLRKARKAKQLKGETKRLRYLSEEEAERLIFN
jgi:hypothetical protein